MKPGLIALAVVAALGFVSCSQEVEHTPQERACIAERFSLYDPKKLDQCMDVCRVCMKGSTVTCSTSCKLKGAT